MSPWNDRELREANRHVHEFLGMLGHELRLWRPFLLW